MSEPTFDPPEPGSLPAVPSFPSSRRVVILGASIAGLRAALTLDRLLLGRRDYRITLVDQNDYHQIRTRLPAVAAGTVAAQDATLAIRRLLGARRVEVVTARVESVDLAERVVYTSAGPIGYRWLTLALGVESSGSGIEALDAASEQIWSVSDARRFGERLLETIRQAAWKLDAEERSRLATIAVLGGSRFGVELAGALGERVRSLAAHFRLPAGGGRVWLVEASERVLPTDPRQLSDAAAAALASAGVELRLGTAIVGASDGAIELASGERIHCGLVVRTSPGQLPGVLRSETAAIGSGGSLLVDREMRLPEHLGAYAAGPGTALMGDELDREMSHREAARQGEVAAHNVFAEIAEAGGAAGQRRQFSPEVGDVVLAIGSHDAVGLVRGVTVSGWRARLVHEAAELAYLEAIGGAGGVVAGLGGLKEGLGRVFRR